jgi:hypothetical protein
VVNASIRDESWGNGHKQAERHVGQKHFKQNKRRKGAGEAVGKSKTAIADTAGGDGVGGFMTPAPGPKSAELMQGGQTDSGVSRGGDGETTDDEGGSGTSRLLSARATAAKGHSRRGVERADTRSETRFGAYVTGEGVGGQREGEGERVGGRKGEREREDPTRNDAALAAALAACDAVDGSGRKWRHRGERDRSGSGRRDEGDKCRDVQRRGGEGMQGRGLASAVGVQGGGSRVRTGRHSLRDGAEGGGMSWGRHWMTAREGGERQGGVEAVVVLTGIKGPELIQYQVSAEIYIPYSFQP